MKLEITVKKEYNINIINCIIGVRYWEDAEYYNNELHKWVNDDEDNPTIPCIMCENWCPTININTKQILNWTPGCKFKTHYKCCDCFHCEMLSDNGLWLCKYKGYVPEGLGEYGDYVVWEIDENGYITSGFDFTQETVDYMIENNLTLQ